MIRNYLTGRVCVWEDSGIYSKPDTTVFKLNYSSRLREKGTVVLSDTNFIVP